ncbi:MAG TPA: FecR family protein [Candidatus Angelobacter sp.]|nr:FecR family protein [Candidatus Angelobacter sp.]
MSRILRLLLLPSLLLSFTLLLAQEEQDAPAQNPSPQESAQQESVNSRVRIVRLSFMEGGVQIDTGNGLENATLNLPVTEGSRLLTSASGWAEVQFEDGSTIRVAPGTQLTFAQLQRTPSGKTLSTIDLDQGEAEFKITAHDGAEFGVSARNKTIVLKHSGRFRVTATNSDPLEVAVFKGEVAVTDTAFGKQIAVKKNETFTLDQFDPARYDLEKEASLDELDRWSQQRDQAVSSYASAQSYTQSPYQYGLGDLNSYGQFYDVAGYGNLWQPNGIYPGWDPFMNGYWSFSPGFGYCWVSGYPWGWMPYRYGHWVFINGRGWFWQPGAWTGWARGPRFVNPPHGFIAPAPPFRAGNGVAPGRVRTPGVTVMDGRPTHPGRVLTNQDEPPAVRPPVHQGSDVPSQGTPARSGEMNTKPAVETRHETPGSEGRHDAPESHPQHHQAPAPAAPSEHAAPPATAPHSAPAPAAAPHSAPAPHVSSPSPHVSAPASHSSPPAHSSGPK